MLLAIRFMIEFKYHFDAPFGFKKPEDIYFMQYYLMYLKTYKYDDLPHWNEEDLEFYNRRSFAITKDSSREEIYKKLKNLFDNTRDISDDMRNLLEDGFDDFNHWYSVI